MNGNLALVLGDQLSKASAALKAADKRSDIVLMAEVAEEAGYVDHHQKKIAFVFAIFIIDDQNPLAIAQIRKRTFHTRNRTAKDRKFRFLMNTLIHNGSPFKELTNQGIKRKA